MADQQGDIYPVRANVDAGDYRYFMEKLSDGTYRCERTPLNTEGMPPEPLLDWSQLPPEVRVVFNGVKESASKKSDPVNGTPEVRFDPH